MKIYRISSTKIEQLDNNENIGGFAWDMMETPMEHATFRGYWNTGKIPYLIECANSIFRELENNIHGGYFSEQYINEKLNIIQRWIDQFVNNSVPETDSIERAQKIDLKPIQHAINTVSKMQCKSSQQIAIKRLMLGILNGDKEEIIKNMQYFKRWLEFVKGQEHPLQNKGEEPKY